MRVTIDINCRPSEVRAFFGLPYVKPVFWSACRLRSRMQA